MPRPTKGTVRVHTRKDGSEVFSLRVSALGRRGSIRLGTDLEGWSREKAEAELQLTLARILSGSFEWPDQASSQNRENPSFHEFASRWLQSRKHELRPKTYERYSWILRVHLLPQFAPLPVRRIDIAAVDGYREQKLIEREELQTLRKAGMPRLSRRGAPLRGLDNHSVNMTIGVLAQILDVAVERRLLDNNPARGRRRRLAAGRRRHGFLEADELEALIEAGGLLDATVPDARTAERARRAHQLRDEGLGFAEVARRLGCAVSTAHRLNGLAQQLEDRKAGSPRRAALATLGCAGLRASELCELDWERVDFPHRKIRLPDAKTPAGVRQVDMSPRLLDELLSHWMSVGSPRTGIAFPTGGGGRRDATSLNRRVVKPALRRANELRADRALPELPERVTPHTLRRTYISLLLEAGAPIPYVMSQVGHEDSKTTLEIYAQVLKRRQRGAVGEAFDRLMQDAVPPEIDANAGGLESPAGARATGP
jgi:integrase